MANFVRKILISRPAVATVYSGWSGHIQELDVWGQWRKNTNSRAQCLWNHIQWWWVILIYWVVILYQGSLCSPSYKTTWVCAQKITVLMDGYFSLQVHMTYFTCWAALCIKSWSLLNNHYMPETTIPKFYLCKMENHWPVTTNLPECCMEAFWELAFMSVSFKTALATIMSVFDRGVILWMLSFSWAVGHCIENPIFKTLSACYVKYTWSLNVLWSTYGFEIQVHSQYYSGWSWTNQYVTFQNIEV